MELVLQQLQVQPLDKFSITVCKILQALNCEDFFVYLCLQQYCSKWQMLKVFW